jgi:hypothetical protein
VDFVVCALAVKKKSGQVMTCRIGPFPCETWCECWNIKIDEDKTRAIYFPHRIRPPEAHLILNGQNIPFANHVKYLGVIFDKRIIWRLHIKMTEAKDFTTFIRIYSLFKNECLSTNIKLTLHKALIRSVITCSPCLGISGRHLPLKIATPTKHGFLYY